MNDVYRQRSSGMQLFVPIRNTWRVCWFEYESYSNRRVGCTWFHRTFGFSRRSFITWCGCLCGVSSTDGVPTARGIVPFPCTSLEASFFFPSLKSITSFRLFIVLVRTGYFAKHGMDCPNDVHYFLSFYESSYRLASVPVSQRHSEYILLSLFLNFRTYPADLLERAKWHSPSRW